MLGWPTSQQPGNLHLIQGILPGCDVCKRNARSDGAVPVANPSGEMPCILRTPLCGGISSENDCLPHKSSLIVVSNSLCARINLSTDKLAFNCAGTDAQTSGSSKSLPIVQRELHLVHAIPQRVAEQLACCRGFRVACLKPHAGHNDK